MLCEMQLAGDFWVKGAVLIQNIDITAAHFSEVKPEFEIPSMLGSDLYEMEECLVSPWLHEPVWRCLRVSVPGTFQSLNFCHYSTPDLCKGTTVSREIWFLILGGKQCYDQRFGNWGQVFRVIVCPGGFDSRNRTE